MWSKNLLFVAGLALLAGCGPVQDPKDMAGQKAPDFQVESLQSKALTTSLAQYKGKAVIIDFWATWCKPCRMLSPVVEKIYEDNKAKGLVAMAISDENRGTVQEFESVTPHHMPVYVDENDIATLSYKVDQKGLPTVIIVDKAGNVVYDQTGFIGGQMSVADQSMRAAVEKALGTS